MNTRRDTAIIYPPLRPPPTTPIWSRRKSLGTAISLAGAVIFVAGLFVSFGDGLSAIGSALMITGAFVFGPLHSGGKPNDIRKLYRQRFKEGKLDHNARVLHPGGRA